MKPELEASGSRNPTGLREPGRLILEYLLEKRGATMPEIVRHLKSSTQDDDEADLTNKVEHMLENAIALGFLERKGSVYQSWVAREAGCRRRRRKSRCRRRRRRKSRCCCARPRRRRKRKRRC